MKLSKLLAGSVTATLLASTLLAGGNGTHWGYTGHEAPKNWGNLSSDYSLCKDGKTQSPINITSAVTIESSNLEKIGFDYSTGISSVINNGHTIQVNFDKGSSITIDGIKFPLIQFHFHTPSENQINGKNFPLEGHFVHATKEGSLAVVALMFEDGTENPFIKKVWAKMPHNAGGKNAISISAKEVNTLLPTSKDYYRFSGSLTTPPCSEGVRWLVLKNYTTISKSQVKEFIHLFHDHANNRPIQPINARKVMK
ncbi:carbonic anhydrase [Sulfurimonas sp. CS5]|uniref:carbonic anhydrase n=1 Tax=Sulfurimonas sp. CS5 TaxID=3391145 RepID=UPI0039EC9959